MKTRILTLIMSLFITTMAFASVEIDGIYYNLNSENKTAEVTYQYEILHINNYSGITTITIPSSVTYNSETYSVTSIGNSAFSFCSTLTSITIPNSVTSIGDYAFNDCSSLTSISIPNSVTSIGNDAFEHCTSLSSISIPNSVTSIGKSAFKFCSSLTSISIPNSVTSIGNEAFWYCSSLASITIPNSVTSIGSSAFSNTPWLNNQPNGCLYAGSCLYAYKGEMPENTHINVKEGTTQICGYAFYSCSSLTSISIPNSVTSISEYAFSSCSSLTSITIEATTPPTLGSGAFNQGTLIYIPDNTLSAYKSAWGTDYVYVNNENSLTINVETPGTLSNLIFNAGQRPAFVVKLKVTGTLNDDDFTCMRETMTSLVEVDLSEITNTTGVNFNGKSNLVKIILPNNLTSIGDEAFVDCKSLTSITIPNSVTSIGSSAFYYCSSLKSITIGNNVTSIGRSAFYYCTSLTSITIPNSVTSISEYAFSSCTSLSSISIPNSVTSISEYAFSSCSSLTSITIPNSVTSIGNSAFYYCTSLTSITIPNSVTSIGEEAFYWCSSLTSITIPNSVTSIGESAFQSCKSLTSISIPNSVTTIGEYAFYWCSSLSSITIPNSVTSIGKSAFKSCSQLDTIICLGSTPPAVENLEANTQTCVLVVPKVAYTDYLRHAYWGQFFTIETIDVDYKTIIAIANNSEWGSVEGGGYYDNGETATLTAIPNNGYRFVKWDDEVTDNPRTIVVTQDSTFTAIFEPNTFTITTAVNDEDMGSVSKGGEYAHGTEVTLSATTNAGYRFAQWSDGNTNNPRTITVTENRTYTAEFEVEVFGLYAASENPSMGGVEVTLTAKPIKGFEFVEWTDGNTDNPRILRLTEDTEIYARFRISENTEVNLETSKIQSANIYSRNGILHVEGAETDYYVLDMAGRLIYSGRDTEVQLPRGVYLVTIKGEVQKIVL